MAPNDRTMSSTRPERDGEAPAPLPPLVVRALAAVLVVAWAVRLLASGGAESAAGSAIELAVLAALLAWSVGTWLPVREVVAAVGAVRLGALACLVVGVLAGQHLRSENLYPFKRWDMYTVPTTTSGYIELRLSADGEDRGPLPIDAAVPTSSTRAYLAALEPFVARAAADDGAARDVLVRALQAVVDEAGVEGVDEVVARHCVVDGPTREQPATCTQVLTVAVDTPEEGGS